MRAITGTDITDFYTSRNDLLALTADGEYVHLDRDDVEGETTTYAYATTIDGDEVQILLDRATIEEGDWFPDVLDDDGAVNLTAGIADEMAQIILNDGILPSRVGKAIQAEADRKAAQQAADDEALRRADAVAEVVAYCGGNQSEAGRLLGVDQSAVNRLVAKSRKNRNASKAAT